MELELELELGAHHVRDRRRHEPVGRRGMAVNLQQRLLEHGDRCDLPPCGDVVAGAERREPLPEAGNRLGDVGTRRMRQLLFRALQAAERAYDRLRRRIKRRLGLDAPRTIAAYHGYGDGKRLWVRGRLLADEPAQLPEKGASIWANLRASLRRWETDEVPGATLCLEVAGHSEPVQTDAEGYYEAELPCPASGRIRVHSRYQDEQRILTAEHAVTVPGPDARYAVVSDLDDTILRTGLTSLLTAARLTLLRNARSRSPLPGMAELYRGLAGGASGDAANPLFYVSASPWNLYDLVRGFLELEGFPPGPLLLHDVGLEAIAPSPEDARGWQIETIERLLRIYSGLPFVLVGDSGQGDPQRYAEIARRHPGRVRAVYIRDVAPDTTREADSEIDAIVARVRDLGVPMVRGRHGLAFAEHAVAADLVPAAILPALVQQLRDQDVA